MSKQLKPRQMWMQFGRDGLTGEPLYSCDTDQIFNSDVPCLVLPLTPASRKRMIEAMAADMFYCDKAATLYEKAEAALAALEKMAGEKS